MTRVTRILVPTDFSDSADEALACAKALAGRFGASLHLLHAFEEPVSAITFASELATTLPRSLRNEMRRDAEHELAERLPASQKVYFRGTAEIVNGQPAPTILKYAAALGADLLVMGSHGRTSLVHALLGSVTERVVRTTATPVLTIRHALDADVARILVPTDFSDTADAALAQAFLVADRFDASLHLLHVLDDPLASGRLATEADVADMPPAFRAAMLQDAQTRLVRLVQTRPESAPPVRVDGEVVFGHGARTIADYAAAQDIDLIVMGTHGRAGIARLVLGSVAERLLRCAPCPVLTVRHPKASRPPTELVYDVEHLPA